MSRYAKLYIAAILSGGLVCLGYAMAVWTCQDPLHFLCIVGLTVAASTLKVTVPGLPTTLSVSFVFVLLSMIDFSYPETLVVSCLAVAVQCVWRKKRQKPLQLLFNLASLAISVWAGCMVYYRIEHNGLLLPGIGIAATVYFLINTLSIAGVITLTGGGNL